MIKRISLLLAAALLVATMAMAGLAAPAFAVNTCKDPQPDTNPSPGKTETSCVKGSKTITTEKRGQGEGQGNSSATTCKKNKGCTTVRPA